LDDANFRVRLDAVEWLGGGKVPQAVAPITRYIDRMEKMEDWTEEPEICECAAALGQIGDKDSLPAVRKACRHMFDGASKRGRGLGRYDLHHIFAAYHAMAQLGAKDEAIKDLRSLYESQKGRMEQRTRQEFQKQLELASKWEAAASSTPATAPARRAVTAPG
jgi:HEAT repeat protein